MPKINVGPALFAPLVAARTLRGPVFGFAGFAAVNAVLVGAVVVGLVGVSTPAVLLAMAGYALGVALAIALIRKGFPHPALGLCNVVTLARLALTAALLAPIVSLGPAPWAVFAVAAIALILDGADGWLARRAGRVSDFGARFDMEVDAALGLILALNAWAAGTVGPEVLIIALPRYVFVAAAYLWPWLNGALPQRFSRKAVCVLQIGGLIALQMPILPPLVPAALVGLIAAALMWSFGRDVVLLWRHRR
ncbi:Phosphatidylglycerophosphate synthase [Pseudorhodobacter antarcticus]|uniref:Phosphatidylglycerophosphate synthase n=1 Tax=Pseudorhodobacter antarcticus TaxID=1077947 RepID=A0A1H8H4U5_9RHOB|nr:CDP-alcohol phosphatidyltransferase family protein [Pseudorhodobacter antarcticus]SEN51155.1 Phosphatidylglycerophosphate synthase [Pseudorhodobacter antarcticus]